MVIGSKALQDMSTGMIGPASIDLTLANCVMIPKRADRVQLGDRVQYRKVGFSKQRPFILKPGRFVLAATNEPIAIPINACGFVQGRSSIGRIGLFVQNAGFVDPGFFGTITLELYNASPSPIALIPGYRVVQLVVMDVRDNEYMYNGKYNGQSDPTGSRMHLDLEAMK